MKFPLHLLFATLLLAGLLTSCGPQGTPSAGPLVLAKVGDQVITVQDLQQEATRRLAAHQSLPEKSVLLQQMVDRLAMVLRAKMAKLDQDAETKRTLDGVLITKLRAQELEQKLAAVEITEAAVLQAFQATVEKAPKAAKVRLAVLFQEFNPNMSPTKQAEIRQHLEEGVQKADMEPATGGRGPAATGFGPLAVDYSEDQVTRYRGGDIGWLEVGNFSYRWPKPILEAGYALEKGKHSGIIETPEGLYVLMKTDLRDSTATPLAEARPGLIQALQTKRRRELEENFLQETVRLAKSELHPESLANVVLPASPIPAPNPANELPPNGPVTIFNSKPN